MDDRARGGQPSVNAARQPDDRTTQARGALSIRWPGFGCPMTSSSGLTRARAQRAPWTDPLFRAKAPLRVSFAGGGTDVAPFPEREGGLVLSATINRYAHATLRPRTDGRIRVESLDLGAALEYGSEEPVDYEGQLG